MRQTQSLRSAVPLVLDEDGGDDLAESDDQYDSLDLYSVRCPRCAQPIALLADEETLPEHALCSSPWNPFGLTVCQGSGLPAAEAEAVSEDERPEQHAAALLTLPVGLNWRTQPFSHAAGPGARTLRAAVA